MQHLRVLLTVHVLNTLELTLLLMLTATIIVSLHIYIGIAVNNTLFVEDISNNHPGGQKFFITTCNLECLSFVSAIDTDAGGTGLHI